MSNALLAVIGPSGVGKSTVIKSLCSMHHGYEYLRPLTTRPLRPNEVDKIYVREEAFLQENEAGNILAPNYIFGHWYGPSKRELDRIFDEGKVPVIDWIVQDIVRLAALLSPHTLRTIYIKPKSNEQLAERLEIDRRDPDGLRYDRGVEELLLLDQNAFPTVDHILTSDSPPSVLAQRIHDLLHT